MRFARSRPARRFLQREVLSKAPGRPAFPKGDHEQQVCVRPVATVFSDPLGKTRVTASPKGHRHGGSRESEALMGQVGFGFSLPVRLLLIMLEKPGLIFAADG
jgi:hypothetical protein